MQELDKKISVIKKIITSGIVKHIDIVPRLKSAGISENYADQIAELSIEYARGFKKDILSFVSKKIKNFFNFLTTIIFSIISATVFAEIEISKIVSNGLLESKLNGFYEHFLFWIGKKKIEVSSIEMIQATLDLFSKTDRILLSLVSGFIAGYIIWKILIAFFSFVIKREKLKFKIQKILTKTE